MYICIFVFVCVCVCVCVLYVLYRTGCGDSLYPTPIIHPLLSTLLHPSQWNVHNGSKEGGKHTCLA